MSPPGFFDLDNRYESISKLGDPLEVLDQAIPWETFRPVLSKALRKFKKSNAGRKHKLIRTFELTDASVHDSQVFDRLLDSNNTGKQVFADSAYRSEEISCTLKERGLKNEIHHKGYRDTPLTGAKQRVNHKRSKVRALVEYIFGFQQNSLGGRFIRTIGLSRARAKIGLMTLACNMKRYVISDKEQTCLHHRINGGMTENSVPAGKNGNQKQIKTPCTNTPLR